MSGLKIVAVENKRYGNAAQGPQDGEHDHTSLAPLTCRANRAASCPSYGSERGTQSQTIAVSI